MEIDDKYKEKRLDECQTFHYSQSGKMSNLARTIIFGIIGTIWIISYSEKGFIPANRCLYWALCLSFLYLLIDVSHYFVDSLLYRYEYFRLDKNKNDNNFVTNTHESYMNKVSKNSFIILLVKFLLLLTTSICFIVGAVNHFNL